MLEGKRYRIETVPTAARQGWSLVIIDRPRDARVQAEFEAACGGRIVVHIAPVRIRPTGAGSIRISVRENVEVRFEASELADVEDVLRAIDDLKRALAAGSIEAAAGWVGHAQMLPGRPRRRRRGCA